MSEGYLGTSGAVSGEERGSIVRDNYRRWYESDAQCR